MDNSEQKKRKSAAALTYEADKDLAPRITAKGKGIIAEKILALAREHNIPIYQDEELISLLEKLEVGDLIPPELYKVVAEVLAWVYTINKKYK